MLVLSRQKNQRINFPGLGVSVEILDVKGSKVSVGVDAPIEVRILRGEIEDYGEAAPKPSVVRLPQELRHDLRNTLHELSLMMHVYRRQLDSGVASTIEAIDADKMFEAVVQRLQELSRHGSLAKPTTPPPTGVAEPSREAGVVPSKALVVDDNDNERELLSGFLRMCDYRVSTARDGLEAIDHLERNEPPSVILLDIQMPRCDGQAFLKKLRAVQLWAPIHVFVVSGNEPSEYGLTPEDGYTHWFSKPLDPRRIVDALARVEKSSRSAS